MKRYIRQIIAILVLAMAGLNAMAQTNPFDKFAGHGGTELGSYECTVLRTPEG